jgi:hypothetical protein
MSKLELRVPMVGKDGTRNNVENLVSAVSQLVAPGTLVDCLIKHDDGCPCCSGDLPITHCTCQDVDVVLDTYHP